MNTHRTRLSRLEAQRLASRPLPVAIVNVCDLAPAEAQKAIAEKQAELLHAGFDGTLIILDC